MAFGRALLSRNARRSTPIAKTEWRKAEKTLKIKISQDVRERIEAVNAIYAVGSSLNLKENTVSTLDIINSIDKWCVATEELRSALKLNPIPKNYHKYFMKKLSRMLKKSTKVTHARYPLEFFSVLVDLPITYAYLKRSAIIERGQETDLWPAWVCTLAHYLEHAGAKISASKSPKPENESPFIKFIEQMQSHLPDECYPFRTYQSIAKHFSDARNSFGEMPVECLLSRLGKGLSK